ncbi:MAG: 8-amino-7-oxononanoate synthase, partial [Pseudonocardiaceae bacterium]
LPGRVLDAAASIAAAAGVPRPPSGIIPVVLGEPARAFDAAAECLRHGLRVGCFRPPSVPTGTSRLRVTAHAALTEPDLERVSHVLGVVLARVAT